MKRTVVIVAGLVALLVLTLLAGPALVDWNRYKDSITARLQRATGRDVSIAGPIGLRLLPNPALTASQVSIGNPPKSGLDQPFATVERLDIRLSVLPLVTGRIQIAALDLERPQVHLARLPDGSGNWRFDPAEQSREGEPARQGKPSLKGEPAATTGGDDGVVVDQATIRDGTVTWRGDGHALRIDAIAALVRAGGPSGPFAATGDARLGDSPFRFDAAVDRLAPGRGAPVNVSLSLPETGAKLDFAGMLSRLAEGEGLHGRLDLSAPDAARVLAGLGMAPPAPLAAPLSAQADLALAGGEMSADNLTLSLGDARVTGRIGAAAGEVPQVEANLHLTALDLDKWHRAPAAKVEERPAPRHAPPAAAPSAPAAAEGGKGGGFALPAKLFADLKLTADTLGWRGQVVRQARLEATLAEGELVVRRLAGQLPGGSTVEAEGTIAATGGQPVFDGSLKLGSDNPHALLAWLGSDFDALPPGRLTVASPLKVRWPDITLADLRLGLGTDTARGRLSARLDQPLAFDLAADTPKWGEVAAAGTLAGETVDARVQVWGLAASVKGRLGETAALTVAARHPDTARLLRQAANHRARGPLGPLAVDARIGRDGAVWTVSDLSLSAGPARLTGNARADLSGARPQITAELAGNDLALDPFLAAERTGFLLPGGPRLPGMAAPPPLAVLPAAAGMPAEAPWSREPLDLSALRGFDARIGLTAASVSAKDWRLDGANARLAVQDGAATVERLTGKLLGGDLSLTAKLSGGPAPALSGQVSVAGADVGAARPKAGDVALTKGRLDAEARFAAQGRSSYELVSRLNGDGRMQVKDGMIAGFDLPAVNQRLNHIENVGSLFGLVQAGMAGGSTPFSSLAGTFQAKDGVLSSRDMKLDAQGGGATGESVTDLSRWTTATTIALRLADSSAPPVLVKLEGPLGNPRKVIDINAVQQYLVARGLGRALKKDGGLVESLMGGKRAAKPENQASPPQEQPAEKPNGARVLRDLLKGFGGR